ncbi:MAG: hypothetical protein M3384_15045 [Acidobacteriota bacterium]|nr:hypothetical protein [Acidobacteriota bacterium]
MSLITCPDCGNQVSTEAVACPQCGRPMAPAVVAPIPQREVIIQPPRRRGFPPWVIAPIIILGAVLVFVLFAVMRSNDDEGNRNLNVNLSQREAANARTARLSNDSRTGSDVTVPSTSVPSQPSSEITVPPSQSTSVTTPETRTTTVDSTTVATGKSSLTIDAKIRGTTGREQPVQRETFYLLKKDLRSILEEADIDDEEGQGLVNAFGMSIVYPGRYPEIRRKALAAISKYTVAKTLTDGQGKAKFPDVKPDSYYLFGITKTPEGFSVWDTPVTLSDGTVNLNLEPSGGR